MNTRPLRILLAVNLTVSTVICVVFLLHHIGLNPFPDVVDSWLAANQWLMWIAVAFTVAGALALPSLHGLIEEAGDDR